MSNQSDMIQIIKAMSGQANLLTIPRPYIAFMGSLDGGLLLSQMIYWSDRSGRNDGLFYKSYKEWEAETTLSKYEVGKQVKIMKDKGFLETELKKADGAPTVHYRFSFSEFQKSFVKFLDNRKLTNLTMESEETLQSLTETNTETNTEKKEDFAFAISALSLAEIKETKLPLKDWKQWLEDERAERNRASVISFLEKKIEMGQLLPDTEASRLLFAKIATEAEAKGRRPPTKFPTLECKSRFDHAAGRLNGTLERAIDNGLAAGITSIPKLTAYISSPKWQQGGKNGSERTGKGKQSFNGKTGASAEYRPKVGNGQSPELRARLEAAFSRND